MLDMLERGDGLQSGRYRVERLVAKGGMGAVYEAVDERFRNRVAVKESLFPTGELAGAFEREARLLRLLKHEGLPVVIDYFLEGEGAYLVMDYVDGPDLGTMLDERLMRGEGPLDVEEVVRIGLGVLDVLAYLHGQPAPIVHRDIKPRNLKLAASGRVMVLDFGLAKGSAAEMSVPTGRSVAGYTPHYAPIEQVAGRGTDIRSDLYSVGATMYRLLTGETPADATTRAAVTSAGEPDPQRRADEVRRDVPKALADVLWDAMSPNPRLRPQSAAEFSERLFEGEREARDEAADAPRVWQPPPWPRDGRTDFESWSPPNDRQRFEEAATLPLARAGAGGAPQKSSSKAAVGIGVAVLMAIMLGLIVVVGMVGWKSRPRSSVPEPAVQPPIPTTPPPIQSPPTDAQPSHPVATKAVILNRPRPNYTEQARQNGTQGSVTVRVLLGANGKVKSASVVKGLPDGLNEKALEAVYQLSFTPAKDADGNPIDTWVSVNVGFTIR